MSRKPRRRASQRPQHSQPQHSQPQQTEPARPELNPTGRRRLILLVVFGALLVVAALVIRHRVGSNPLLKIPPIETADLLPAVAKEIQDRQTAILDDPTSAEAWGEYGLVLLAHGFRREAGDCFVEAEQCDDKDYRWPYYLGMTAGIWDTEGALAAFRRAVALAPNRLSVRLRLAEWCFDLRLLDQCEKQVLQALDQDPESRRAQLILARLKFQQDKIDESRALAEAVARSQQGNRRDVHELLAQIYQRLGERDAATAEVALAEKLPRGLSVWDDPEMGVGATYLRDATIVDALARISRDRGDQQAYLQRLRQTIELDPRNVGRKEKLAVALVEAERFDEAAETLDSAMAQHPHSARLRLLRGTVDFAQGRLDLALRWFEKAVELKPDYDEAFAQLGHALWKLEDHQAAAAALREAIRLNPAKTRAYDLLGQVLADSKAFDESIVAFRNALKIAPDHSEIRTRLAEALLAANRRDEALQELRVIIKTGKTTTRATELLENIQHPTSNIQ